MRYVTVALVLAACLGAWLLWLTPYRSGPGPAEHILPSVIPAPAPREDGVRDGTFAGLAHLLNTMPLEVLPEREFASMEQFRQFALHLAPWISGAPAAPLKVTRNPEPLVLSCADPRYADVLRGVPRRAPAVIVDLVLIGYEIDLVEVRLLANYNVVDVFVLFESPWTQRGVPKPLFFNLSRALTPARWARFADKIVYLTGDEADLEPGLMEKVRNNGLTSVEDPRMWDMAQPHWKLENSMRTLPIRKFRQSTHELAQFVRAQIKSKHAPVYLLQNDGDEIAAAAALWHLKHCEVKREPSLALPLWLPCTVNHINAEWFEFHIKSRGVDKTPAAGFHYGDEWAKAGLIPHPEMAQYLWTAAPGVILLQELFASDTVNLNDIRENMFGKQRNLHFGPGAAVHLSDPRDPALVWLKRAGVVEQVGYARSVPESILRAARNRTLTALAISRATLLSCRKPPIFAKLTHESEFASAATAEFFRRNLPWPLRENPDRYPAYMAPVHSQRCRFQRPDGEWCYYVSPLSINRNASRALAGPLHAEYEPRRHLPPECSQADGVLFKYFLH